MAVEAVTGLAAGVTDLLEKASKEPLILRTVDRGDFALLPLDDDIVDLLLERNPRFIEECAAIRARMEAGDYLNHEQVVALLDDRTEARE